MGHINSAPYSEAELLVAVTCKVLHAPVSIQPTDVSLVWGSRNIVVNAVSNINAIILLHTIAFTAAVSRSAIYLYNKRPLS